MKSFRNLIPALFIATLVFFCLEKYALAASSGSVTVTVQVTPSISISSALDGFLEVRNNTSKGCYIIIDDNTYFEDPLSSQEIAVDPDARRVTVVSNI